MAETPVSEINSKPVNTKAGALCLFSYTGRKAHENRRIPAQGFMGRID